MGTFGNLRFGVELFRRIVLVARLAFEARVGGTVTHFLNLCHKFNEKKNEKKLKVKVDIIIYGSHFRFPLGQGCTFHEKQLRVTGSSEPVLEAVR